jgi:glucose/arabinose dehydrogenase
MHSPIAIVLVTLLAPASAALASSAPEPGYGPSPELPAPDSQLIPTVDIAPAVGWPEGASPRAAPGLAVTAFATGLDHPRWLHVLPNGDVLVAESNGPPRPEQRKGIKGWVMKRVMARAGAGTPSADRITLLRDADGDGRAEVRSVFLADLHSPFGMALVGKELFVANTDALVAFPYAGDELRIAARGRKVADLPAGPLNHHWTKNVIARPDGARLYVTVGSNSNVAEHGLEKEERRAAILEVDPASGDVRVYASGLRNPNGMDWNPTTGELWTVVNERDEIGDDLVPDYLTKVVDGGFYGWPWSYWGHIDERVEPVDLARVASARMPDYGLGAHTGSLGLVFYDAKLLPSRYAGGAFIGQHGSWNRSELAGYRVIFVPFARGEPDGLPQVVLDGFLDDDGNARGRPVGTAVDGRGALLVADDVGNAVWRVTPDDAPTPGAL